MKSLRVFRFRLPLREPLRLAGVTLTEREGFLLRKGNAWAEAAPLPGFSEENLEWVETEIRGLLVDPESKISSPALGFALWSLEQNDAGIDCPISGLLHGEDVFSQAEALAASGCPAAKLKVGAHDLEEDVARVRGVLDRLGETRLRLDVNQQWNMRQALKFARRFGDVFEYIEEPLSNPAQLPELCRRTNWTIALDESLRQGVAFEGMTNIVKPTLSPIPGGDGGALVLSSSFESAVGLYRIAQHAGDLAAGLDTAKWFAENVFEVSFTDWRWTLPAMPKVDETNLEELIL